MNEVTKIAIFKGWGHKTAGRLKNKYI